MATDTLDSSNKLSFFLVKVMIVAFFTQVQWSGDYSGGAVFCS